MANMVKVQNHEARVTTVGYAYGKIAGGHGTGTHKLRLKPGVNEIERDAWEQAKKLPVIQAMIKSHDLEELSLKQPGLKGYTVDGAIEVVEGTFDRELLRKWKGDETRDAVISSIETQIVKTAPTPGELEAPAADSKGNIGDLPAPEARSAAVGFTSQEIAEQLQNGQAEPTSEEIKAAEKRADEAAAAAKAKAAKTEKPQKK